MVLANTSIKDSNKLEYDAFRSLFSKMMLVKLQIVCTRERTSGVKFMILPLLSWALISCTMPIVAFLLFFMLLRIQFS